MPNIVYWSLLDLAEIIFNRQKNKLDGIIAWSGARGVGKSTGAFKLGMFYNKRRGRVIFSPRKHLLYSRKEIMDFMEKSKFLFFIDDEAIRSSYKRNFQDSDQKIWVQMLNMYRSNYNIVNLCIPKFYALDRDLRDLIKIHIHVIKRGLGVVHISRDDVLYSDDPWDVAYNQKVESRWSIKRIKNPSVKMPYHKLTTFAGYIRLPKLTTKQEQLYERIKQAKRRKVYEQEMKAEMQDKKKLSNIKIDNEKINNIYSEIKKRNIDRAMLEKISTINGWNFKNILVSITKRANSENLKIRDILPMKDNKVSKPLPVFKSISY